jgi:5-formyltetrahydrofolate cyclo-ligase
VEKEHSVAESKTTLREIARAARAARSDVDRAADAELLSDAVIRLIPDAMTDVCCYVSMRSEPGTASAIKALLASGRRVWLPRIDRNYLTWVRVDESTTHAPGPLGINEPTGPGRSNLAFAQALLIPAISVDREGRRLGQGGGYYDRTLAGVPRYSEGGPLLAALVFDDEVVDAVPAEPHDRSVDVIVTPTRTIRASTPV